MKRKVNKGKNEEYGSSIKERIEDFLHSDSPSATATKFLLATLALGGLAFGGAIVPGILKALDGLNFSESEVNKKYTKKKLNSALSNLKRQKLVKIIKEKDGKFKIKLTNKGNKRVLKLALENVCVKRPEIWDKKWRIVIFDIPNDFNSAREALRRKMKKLGLRQMQKSVWVYPYDCEDEILFVAEVFKVEKYVEIITAERVLHEKVLKQTFKI